MNRRANTLTLALYCLASVSPVVAQTQTFPAGQPEKFVIPVSVNTDSTTIVNGVAHLPPRGWTSGIRLLLYNRQNLNYIYDSWYNNSADFNNGIDRLLEGENGWPTDTLTLISSINGNTGFPLSEIASRLKNLGATNEFDGQNNTNGTLAFIGHGGLTYGQAYQSGGRISGYFAQDVPPAGASSEKNYSFTPLDYLVYALDPTKGTITVGNKISVGTSSWGENQTWTAPCTDGFFLVRFDRTNPQTATFQKCYRTGNGDQNAFDNLQTDLTISDSGENNGIFLISVGSPVPASLSPDQTAAIQNIAAVIRDLGGYSETFTALTVNDTYALVGFPATPPGIAGSLHRASEGSTLYPGHPSGVLKGALRRGRRYMFYSSMMGDLTGMDDTGLYSIIGQASQPYPHPANAEELTAFQGISQQMCTNLGVSDCNNYNPRDAYPDTNVKVSDLQSALSRVSPPIGVNCSTDPQTAFCTVSDQLFKELEYVGAVRAFNNNLYQFLSNKLTEDSLDLQSTYNRLESTIGPPPTSPTVSIIESVVSSGLSIAGAIPFGEGLEAVGPTFNILGALFGFGTSLGNDVQGNSTTFSYTTTVANLESDTVTKFNNQLNALGTLFDFIYQDWGRLQALGEALNGNSANPNSQWYWNTTVTSGQLLHGVKTGTERSFYESLMAARYEIGYFEAPTIFGYQVPDGNIWGEYCEAGGIHHPFYLYTPDLPDTNVMQTVLMPGSHRAAYNGWVAIGDHNDAWWYCNYTSPGPDILEHLFKSPQDGGLGVYPPEFFNGWAFGHITCSPSDIDTTNPYGGNWGCPWGSGTVGEGAPPVTRLTATLMTNVRDGPQLRVRLLLLNNGNVGLQNVTVDKIDVRVLAGSGEASLASSIPIAAGDLAAGAGTTIEFDLNVPTTVKKLSLIESGGIQSGAGVSQFSQGQVLFP